MPPSPIPTTTPAETGFDPLVFWIQHRSKILLLAGVFAVALIAFALSEYVRKRTNTSAQELFATASTPDGFRKVIAEYAGTIAAGNAHLMLAAKLREEGKLDESTATLRSFADKYPTHPLLSGAWTSIAANLEAQGKADEALSTYQKVTTSYPNTFSAPAALMAQARLLEAKGKTEEARRIYEQVMTQYQENVVAQQAAQEVRRLKK
jgi:TolA-binding protein